MTDSVFAFLRECIAAMDDYIEHLLSKRGWTAK